MASVGFAQLPVPGGGDAPTGPGALAALGLAIDPHLVHHVTDRAARDAQFATAPLHTVVTANNGSLWIKTSASSSTWATVYEPDPDWRPVALASGFQSGNAAVRRIGKRVHVRGTITKSDGSAIVSTTKLGDVPADCWPQHTARGAGGSTITGDPVVGLGRIEVLGQGSNVNGATNGALMWYSQDGSGTDWVGIDFSYWID
ncbi:hypothetical protein [Streptomyces sp. CO7]